MPFVKISAKGQILIPKDIRDRLGLKPNSEIRLDVVDNHIELSVLPNYTKILKGILRDKPSMSKELLSEHKKEIKSDEKVSF